MNRLTNRVLKLAAGAVMCGFAAVGNAAEWTYADGKITDGTWTIPVTWTAGSEALTIKEGASGSGALDLWDLTVDGTPITALTISSWAFVRTSITTFRANHVANDLTLVFYGSTVQSVEVAGDGVTALLPAGNCGCFEGCGSLVSVKFDCPNLKTIGTFAFLNCSKLATPIQEFIPRTVTEIGTRSFQGCSSMGGDLWLDRLDALGGEAFNGAKINSVHWGSGNFTAFPASNNGAFESSKGLTNVFIQAETLSICKFTFLNCSSLTHATFDVKGSITMPSTDRAFQCSAIQELVFTGPAPTTGVVDVFVGNRTASATTKPVTIYCSKLQNGWTEFAAPLTDAEVPLAPEGCFGVYRDGNRKAWLVHRPSPYDVSGGSLAIRPSITDIGTPSVPYGTHNDVEDGTGSSTGVTSR